MAEGTVKLPWAVRTIGPTTPVEWAGPVEFSVIIPAYNEEGGISRTLASLDRALEAAPPHEIVIVNDGSMDGTGDQIRDYLATHPEARIRLVEHRVNSGYGAALKTGIRASSGELIVITDADGTYPVDRIPELVELTTSGDFAMVVGARTGEEVEYSSVRKIPKFFMKAYIDWIAQTDVPDFNSGLRVFRRSVVETFFGILPDGFSFTTTITLSCITNRYPVAFVPISYARRVGTSKIQPIRDTLRFSLLIARTGMYFAPLRVLGPVTVVLLLMAMMSFGFDVVNRNLTDSTVLLFLFTLNTGMFALLADMVDKRSPK